MQIWKLDKKDKGKKVALRNGVFTLKLKLSWLDFSRDSFIKATHPYVHKHRDTRTERLWVTATDTVTQSGRCRLPFLAALGFLGNWLGIYWHKAGLLFCAVIPKINWETSTVQKLKSNRPSSPYIPFFCIMITVNVFSVKLQIWMYFIHYEFQTLDTVSLIWMTVNWTGCKWADSEQFTNLLRL